METDPSSAAPLELDLLITFSILFGYKLKEILSKFPFGVQRRARPPIESNGRPTGPLFCLAGGNNWHWSR